MSLRKRVSTSLRKLMGDEPYLLLRHGARYSYLRLRYSYKTEHSYLRKIKGLIHVGGNLGQERYLYTAFGLDVLWIEPIPHIFAELERSLSGLRKQRALNYLVTDEDGKKYEFHIADNWGAQSSSILDLSKHKEMYPEISYKETTTLPGATLTSILAAERIDIRQYDAMVLDTQGSELKILQGAASLLSNFKFIKVEVPDFEAYVGCCQISELSDFMSLSGFRERSRHLILHTPGVGTYFEVIYERVGR